MKYTDKYSTLTTFGKELLDKKSLSEGLPLISKYAKKIMHADRCSIFIYNKEDEYLWTTLADGVGKIVVDSNMGLVSKTLEVKKPIIENDPYNNPHFLPNVDHDTGYMTKNLITAPIFNSQREIVGILELLNKPDDFNTEDIKFMIFFAHYISGFLELTAIYLDKDKRENNEKI